MKDLSAITKLPEVVGAVLSDLSGAVLDWTDSIDGESVASVHAFVVQSLGRGGETLGLGAFQRASLVTKRQSCVIFAKPDAVIGVYVDPSKPLSATEKKLQDLLL